MSDEAVTHLFGAQMMPPSTTPSPNGTKRDASDGRIALRLKNRRRVIEALIELVDDGNISPSMDEIVERSGVSERSVFRYFSDLEDLSISAIRAVLERAQPLTVITDIGEGPLDHRIDAIIATRLRTAEQLHPFGTLARRKLMLTNEIQQTLTNSVISLNAQFAEQFAPELDAMPAERAAMILDTLVTLFSYEGIEVMRSQIKIDDDAVAQRWRMTMTCLLTDTP